jgi:hypothetical protein
MVTMLSRVRVFIVFEWFKQFKDGSGDLQEEPRTGHPSTSRDTNTIANIHENVTCDRPWALRMMADEFNISKETILESSTKI